jgi:hypothetical protein
MNAQDLATRVSSNLAEDQDPTLDIITIIMIAQLIIKLLEIIKECQEELEIKNPTSQQKAVALCSIRKNLPYGKKFLAKRVLRGIMDEAKKVDDQDLKNMVDQSV